MTTEPAVSGAGRGAGLGRLVREAAWPGLAVLAGHAAAARAFGHEPVVDPVMHFLGGAACAYFVVGCVRLFPRWLGEPLPLVRSLLAFGLTAAVAIGWELVELVSDTYLGSHAHTSIASTMRDLLNGLLGALAFVGADWIRARRRAG